jgi:two-component system, cell cycle sensor histidine kinase and response regulator CckA
LSRGRSDYSLCATLAAVVKEQGLVGPSGGAVDSDLNRVWSVLASVQVGLWEWHVAADRVLWSDHAEQLFGLPAGAFGETYHGYLATLHPDDRSLVASNVEEVMAGTRDGYEIEHRIVWPDGSVRWLGCKARAFRTDAGALVRIAGTVLDVTRRKLAETAVRESDELLRSAMDMSPIGMAIISPSGAYLDANPAFCKLVGYPREELLLRDYQSITLDEDRSASTSAHDSLIAGGPAIQVEKRYLHKQGHTIWAQTNVALVRTPDGAPRYFISQIQDIGERRAAELALRASEHMLRQLTENLREMVWMCDFEVGGVIYVSPGFERILKIPRGDLRDMMRRWLALVHPDDRTRIDAMLQAPHLEQDESYRIVDADGTIRWLHCRTFPILDEAGNLHRLVGILEDITERRRVEHQLHHAQKMEAFGQLAGGVAHDFNNLLAVILPHTELAARARNLEPRVADSLSAIESAAQRAATLTRQLLQLGRREVLQPHDLDLNDTVTAFANLLRRVLREDVTLQLTLIPSLPGVSADPNMLGQVMMNLALNARDAMPDGGTLTISTSTTTLSEEEARTIDSARAGTYTCVEVTDTGHGIDPKDHHRLFEPFFTTKPRDKGTGLGLATVRGIVLQHGGCITVESRVGHGTSVRVLLPSLERPPELVVAPRVATPRGGSELVLVVEDESDVRHTTVLVLEQHGYRVMSAVDAADALRVLAEHGEDLSLVITDLVMPGVLSGRELVAKIAAEWPHIRVVLMSGYSPDVFGRELELRTGDQFVSKPVPISRLLEVMRSSLDHR